MSEEKNFDREDAMIDMVGKATAQRQQDQEEEAKNQEAERACMRAEKEAAEAEALKKQQAAEEEKQLEAWRRKQRLNAVMRFIGCLLAIAVFLALLLDTPGAAILGCLGILVFASMAAVTIDRQIRGW